MQDVEFKVTGRSESPSRIRVAVRDFELVVDEPPQLGGTNQGANPVEFLLTGLVGCLNVVGHLVAKELGFTIERLDIEASGSLNPARLFNQPTEDRAGYKEVNVQLRVQSDADEDMLARWLPLVESRCPVSDNIGNPTPVNLSVSALTAAVVESA